MTFIYNWQASLVVLLTVIAIVALARTVLFMIPAFSQTKADNREENIKKLKTKRGYPARVQSSKMVALATNLFLFIVALPFVSTFESQSVFEVLVDVFAILMIYDFFYYLTHRFLFHGKGYFRKVHAVHHQARNPTSLDALLLHPLEAFIGIALFIVVVSVYAFATSSALHVATLIITIVVYTQINTINHVHIELHRFPYKIVNWVSDKHAVHHIDMHKGNYATITLFFDKVFGTLD